MTEAAADVVIYHNPNCSTSRKVLEMLRDRGIEPQVVEYMKQGWTRENLARLAARMGGSPKAFLRTRNTPAEELGLTAPGARDDAMLAAMIDNPVLVERPIVETARGAVVCRPVERLDEVL